MKKLLKIIYRRKTNKKEVKYWSCWGANEPSNAVFILVLNKNCYEKINQP